MSRFTRVIALASALLLMGSGMASAGLVIGSGMTIGFGPNNFQMQANNTANYAFASSTAAPNQFAIFQTHDPWGATVIQTAITGQGDTWTALTPAQLAGFNFSQ